MEKDTVVISGINGFVGHHLARELHSEGVSVVGIGRETEVDSDISDVVDKYHQADLTEKWPETSKARAIINLAGLAAIGASFDNPQMYHDVNTSIVTNMCEHYLENKSVSQENPRIVIVSSGAVYDSSQIMPIAENGVTDHSSPYAISKVLNEKQAAFYRASGLDCVVVRPFNHMGPGQTQGFILPDLYSRMESLKEGEGTITTGNIETRRDYTDVRDIARAYGKIALAASLKYNLYNICSGSSHSGIEIFNELKKAMNLPEVDYHIDQSLIRPTDASDIIGNPTRLEEEFGWKPEINIHQTIVDFVESKK